MKNLRALRAEMACVSEAGCSRPTGYFDSLPRFTFGLKRSCYSLQLETLNLKAEIQTQTRNPKPKTRAQNLKRHLKRLRLVAAFYVDLDRLPFFKFA